MSWPRLLFFSLLCLMFVTPVLAGEMRALYEAEVVATGTDETARNQDIRSALQLVLGRVITPAALTSRTAAGMLDSAVNYVLSYRYASRPSADNPAVKTDVLEVTFDQIRLTDILRQKGISVWSEQRPDTLVWLVIGDAQRQEWFTPEQMPEIDRELRQAAIQKGLPLAFPLLDLTDQQGLTVEDLGSGADDRVRAVSARYEAAGVLAGRLIRSEANAWEFSWRFFTGDAAPTNTQGQFPSLGEAMRAGVATAYAKLAERFIPKTLSTTELQLRVTGISSLDDVSKISNYLGSLSLIKTVEWLSVQPTHAMLRLSVRGDRKALEEAFAVGRMLRPAEDQVSGFSGMNYQLVQR